MINTHRLMILIVMINIACGLASQIYGNPTGTSTTIIDNKVGTTIEQTETATNEQNTIQKSKAVEGQDYESTALDPVSGGLSIIGLIKDSLYPYSISEDQVETNTEKKLVGALGLIRLMLDIIFIIEVFMLIINKKTS